jgi:hypothetical protein
MDVGFAGSWHVGLWRAQLASFKTNMAAIRKFEAACMCVAHVHPAGDLQTSRACCCSCYYGSVYHTTTTKCLLAKLHACLAAAAAAAAGLP